MSCVAQKLCRGMLLTAAISFLCGSIKLACANDVLTKIQSEADYILECQYMTPGPAYGAINNIYGDPSWVVPRENAMAILGLIMASEALNSTIYMDRAQITADYLVSVQDTEDGAWYNQYNFGEPHSDGLSKSPTQTSEVMIALFRLGYDPARYNSMKKGAEFLMECQNVVNKLGNDDGLICAGKDSDGDFQTWRWVSDNSYSYQALKAAELWAKINGDAAFSEQCRKAAADIISGIDNYFYNPPVWHIAIDQNGTPQGNPDLLPDNGNLPGWLSYTPQMLDLPAQGVNSLNVGEWIKTSFQQPDGSCIGYFQEDGTLKIRKYPGLTFQAILCWHDLGQNDYITDGLNWTYSSTLLQTTPDGNGITGGWIDWEEISPNSGFTADWWLRFIDTSFYAIAALSGGYDFNVNNSNPELDQELYQTSLPYIKYFNDRALGDTPTTGDPDGFVFEGLTKSFQLYLGGHSTEEEALIFNGASSYDQSLLGRICLTKGVTTILDTFVNHLSDANNPLMKRDGGLHNADGNPIDNGPYRIARILGRDIPVWYSQWDWIVDTGAAATMTIYAVDAYRRTQNEDYKNIAKLFGEYMLKLKDDDGGIRYGPIGMYHDSAPITLDFYWKLKSTEQNERILAAFNALYSITHDVKYSEASDGIKGWLKDMYNPSVHLFETSATYNDDTGMWEKPGFGYVATDAMAFAPIELMFNDSYFGSTQAQRDAEVDAMFQAIEERTAFLDNDDTPIFYKFSISQSGDYGSVEMSAQMALAYLRVAQIYDKRGVDVKTHEYLIKYNTLVSSLGNFFTVPGDDPDSLVAPYASFLDGSVAGGVPTGTGYFTYNCEAALASVYYSFAKAGYDPLIPGGGPGIPQTSRTLNMLDVSWHQNIPPYNSTGAAVAQMILNYINQGAGAALLSQNEIYEYAKSPQPFGPELNADEMDKVLGHFDPYDTLVSNWADTYDSNPDGNQYQGYNYMVHALNAAQMNEYFRDICHWMDYTVTKEEWWKAGELVARPNTPAAAPLFGSYSHWVMIKGFAASLDPCPEPQTNPFNTPDFTIYGFWMKDPLINGIGKDTYKTADECSSTYFLPLDSGDAYHGKLLQIAEPPAALSNSNVKISPPVRDLANLEFIGVKSREEEQLELQNTSQRTFFNTTGLINEYEIVFGPEKKHWTELVDEHLLTDPQALAAFSGTVMRNPTLVKRLDISKSDYYIVPFDKKYKKKIRNHYQNRYLTSGVIILDSNDGHFKEASWTDTPEILFKITKADAVKLLKKHLLKLYLDERNKLPRNPRLRSNLLKKYIKLMLQCNKSNKELVWQPGKYSSSPYQPFWRITLPGNIWIVNQKGIVFLEEKEVVKANKAVK
ncbi:MAG: hypothetical protein ABII27_08155 [bacterium]